MPGKRPIKLALCKTKRHKSGTKERDCCFQDRCALVTRRTVGNNMVTSGYRGHIMSTPIRTGVVSGRILVRLLGKDTDHKLMAPPAVR